MDLLKRKEERSEPISVRVARRIKPPCRPARREPASSPMGSASRL